MPAPKRAPEVPAATNNGADEICEAAQLGDFRAVKKLLARGVDSNAAKSGGWTALMSAGVGGGEDTVALLLAKGANVNAKSENGHTALMSAVGPGGKLAITKMLVSAGADINAQRRDGTTALMVAIISDNYVSARYLLDKGAKSDQTMSPESGGMFAAWTAEDFAKWKGNDALAKRLRAIRNREVILK